MSKNDGLAARHDVTHGFVFEYTVYTLPETNIAHENPHLSW